MDRGLLLALIALQNRFVTEDQFLISYETWLADRSCGLDEIFVVKGFLTNSQRESLVSDLISILEQSNNNWRMGLAGNTAAIGVYGAMVTLAEKDAIALQWIELIGEELGIATSKKAVGKPKADDSDEEDPYDTFDFDELSVPFATLTSDDDNKSK